MPYFAENLRRLMARQRLSLEAVALRSGLDHRTVRAILAGTQRAPRPRTLRQLADGLNVDVDELFQNPALLMHRQFDRDTNPAVDAIVAEYPERFDGWTAADFDELYSQFGHGGALTVHGALATVDHIHHKRQVLDRVAVILETHEADLLATLVDTLYRRVVLVEPAPGPSAAVVAAPPAAARGLG